MHIRPATEADIPEIVKLLKISLGESLVPKSEKYWRWKHIENPFGVSPVLLAFEGQELIGVRAFMRWSWSDGVKIYKAVRAVDTATHPVAQGKGVFKKLTLTLIDQSIKENIDFVFNTPNGQSRPGYLKMGWMDAGTLAIRIFPLRPISMIRSLLTKKCRIVEPSPAHNLLEISNLDDLLLCDRKFRPALTTHYDRSYLLWRYVAVPLGTYTAFYWDDDKERTLIIGRLKTSRAGVEFRLTDLFSTQPKIPKSTKRAFLTFVKQLNCDFITSAASVTKRFKLGVSLPIGPIVTIRNLTLADLDLLTEFSRWSPSLGDLELF